MGNLIKKGLFKKKKVFLEIPKKMQKKLKGNSVDVEMSLDGDVLIVRTEKPASTQVTAEDIHASDQRSVNVLQLYPLTTLSYHDVNGLFKFKGRYYYKPVNKPAVCLENGMTFSSDIKNEFPEMYGDINNNEIGKIEVTPLAKL